VSREREREPEESATEQGEDPAFSALLKRSLDGDAPKAAERELLASVQRKIRKRSKGKFYGDGWSTSDPRINYALVATVMLLTVIVVYLVLGPTGISLK
jgi:hypothetical protein